MTRFVDEQKTMIKHLTDNWNENTLCPMVYPNKKNASAQIPGQIYASVQIVPNEGARMRNSIGQPRLITNFGFLFFTIFAPVDTGTLDTKRIQDALCDLFDEARLAIIGQTDKFIRFEIGEVMTLGEKDATYRTAISFPYHWDEN